MFFVNVYEMENIQINFVVLNYCEEFGGGDFVLVGGYYCCNKDNYVFNCVIFGVYNLVFVIGLVWYEIWVYFVGVEVCIMIGEIYWNVVGIFFDDELDFMLLIFGSYCIC